MWNRTLSFVTAIIMAMGMIACGGSSGGSDGAIMVPPPDTGQLPITSANAEDITADVLGAIVAVLDLTEIGEAVNLPFPSLPAERKDIGVSSDLPFAQLTAADDKGSSVVAPRSILVETIDCDSGTFTNTWDDADDNLEVSTGDTLDISFASCVFFDLDVTLSGSVFITNITMTGDVLNQIPPWSLGANFAFVDLIGTDDSGTATINGNFDVNASTSDGLTANFGVAGSELSVLQDGQTDTLSNFSVNQHYDLVSQTITVDAMGTLTSDRLNGSVSFTTPSSIVAFVDDNPSSGELLITHADSSVRATVLDNISVRLEIDADGDGTTETTLVVTWTDLDFG